MAHSQKQGKRKSTKRQVPVSTKQAKIAGYVGIVAVEALIAGIAAVTNKVKVDVYFFQLPMAWIVALLSLTLGFMGTLCAIAAQQARNDPRPEQKAKAGRLQVASFICIIIPAIYLGESQTYPLEVNAHEVYKESGMLAIDKSILEGTWKDENGYGASRERYADARIAYDAKGVAPKTAHLDIVNHPFPAVWGFLVYLLVTQIPGLVAQPAPETEREAQHRRAMEAAKMEADRKKEIAERREKTRQRNLAIAAGVKEGTVSRFFKRA